MKRNGISLFRRQRSRPNQPEPEARWLTQTSSVHPPVSAIFLVGFGIIAAGLFLLSELTLKPDFPLWAAITQHVGIAFLVAVILGATYEYFLHEYRERMFRHLLDEHREKMFEALKVHLLLTPEQVFDLLSEIAIHTTEIPTLYRPARHGNEYTFSNSIGYFNTLMEVRRKDILNVLRKWIDPKSHRNLKFLASDFIGMYQLHELASELRSYATLELGQLNDENRGWTLNYVWAVSRCEQPLYGWLGDLLCNCDDESIHEWILFVACQMQDKELGQMLERFLESRGDRISPMNLSHTARALAALQRARVYDGKETLRMFHHLFSPPRVLDAVQKAWSDLGVPVELAPAQLSRAEPATVGKSETLPTGTALENLRKLGSE